jgi:hypothetical protein
MSGAFLRGFAAAFAVAVAAYVGLGYAAAALLFQPPPERFYARGISFEAPEGWQCDSEGLETVCDPPSEVDDAILIIATKTVEPFDTLDTYRGILKAPKESGMQRGKFSTVLAGRDSELGGHLWVDATHRGSEIESYDTRYLATTIGATAVLMTFSCHTPACPAMQPALDRLAGSVEVLNPGG